MELKNQKILVLSIDHYEVKDDETGRTSTGTTCYYYTNPELSPLDNSSDSKGVKPAKMSLPENFLSANRELKVPCLATVDFSMRPDSKGKLQLTATNFFPLPGAISLNHSVPGAGSVSGDGSKSSSK